MPAEFDPYHRWLGISPHEQPPSLYRLLGIALFESDLEVIATAADRQMAHLRTFQTGPHGALSQKLLNEVAAARVCLLNPAKRQVYDEQLRRSMTPGAPPHVEPPPVQRVHELQESVSIRAGRQIQHVAAAKTRISQPGVLAAACVSLIAVISVVVWIRHHNQTEPLAAVTQPDRSGKSAETKSAQIPRAEAKGVGDHAASPQSPATADAHFAQPTHSTPDHPSNSKSNSPEPTAPATPAPPVDSATTANSTLPPPQAPSTVVAPATADHPAQSDENLKSPTRQPPDAAELAANRKRVDAAIEGELAAATPEQLRTLVRRLMAQSREVTGEPAYQFALLAAARDLAIEQGDAMSAYEAIDLAAAAFTVNALAMRNEALARLGERAQSPDEATAIVEESRALVEDLWTVEDFAAAQMVGDRALTTARRSGLALLVNSLTAVNRRTEELTKAYAAVQKARDTLAVSPDDPPANGVLGRYECMLRDNWEQGLVYLARGDDEQLSAASKAELEWAPGSSIDPVDLADRWWKVAEPLNDPEKSSVMLHAGKWYARVPSEQVPRRVQTKIDKRLAFVATLGGRETPNNILSDLDVEIDCVAGEWQVSGAGAVVSPQPNARIMLPTAVTGSYNFQVEFTREAGDDSVVVFLPAGARACTVAFSEFHGEVHGLEMIDGKSGRENSAAMRPGLLTNGTRHTALFRMRVRNGQIDLTVLLDGVPQIRWTGPQESLTVYPTWQLPDETRLGLGAMDARVVFHRASVQLVLGELRAPKRSAGN